MRWFRDTERNDIQSELRNWPEGPLYTARSGGDTLARNAAKGGILALGGIIMAALSSAGGNLSGGSGSDSGSDTPHDPADEVADFPVMWAASGTIARSLPWQLDPGRSDTKRYQTHAILTDRRLVIVGLPFYKKDLEIIEDEVLWQIPRSAISGIEPRDFKDGDDFKVTFTDGSWCRLSSFRRQRILRFMPPSVELTPLESLTSAQQRTVAAFVASKVQAPDAASPSVTRRPSGHFRVEILLPSRFSSFFGAPDVSMVMDSDGRQLEITEYHSEDF
ncbi:hypothetical protein [Streptomyces sp. NPDC046925]|uniref:hypothetical protein n=1 Tax=Streptomyces sp. NPDC046925 TaxID=3155375 RepID=UPI0033F8D703